MYVYPKQLWIRKIWGDVWKIINFNMINDLIIILKKQIAVDEFWLFSRGLVHNNVQIIKEKNNKNLKIKKTVKEFEK